MGAADSAKGERGSPQRHLHGSGGEGTSRGAGRQNTKHILRTRLRSLGGRMGLVPECL